MVVWMCLCVCVCGWSEKFSRFFVLLVGCSRCHHCGCIRYCVCCALFMGIYFSWWIFAISLGPRCWNGIVLVIIEANRSRSNTYDEKRRTSNRHRASIITHSLSTDRLWWPSFCRLYPKNSRKTPTNSSTKLTKVRVCVFHYSIPIAIIFCILMTLLLN